MSLRKRPLPYRVDDLKRHLIKQRATKLGLTVQAWLDKIIDENLFEGTTEDEITDSDTGNSKRQTGGTH